MVDQDTIAREAGQTVTHMISVALAPTKPQLKVVEDHVPLPSRATWSSSTPITNNNEAAGKPRDRGRKQEKKHEKVTQKKNTNDGKGDKDDRAQQCSSSSNSQTTHVNHPNRLDKPLANGYMRHVASALYTADAEELN
jgi:hypothetical protein